ncbi:MAG: rhomboid family intramembrane serine protease [Pseudomonas sp.]|uniref:rhomboid family intramembrane serine protease n=1 Tax=Pseudomonas sp. TaxID=306 RepID=UPI003BB5BEA3
MSAIAALRLPLTVNLAAFVALLQRLQVPHRVSEEAGEQVLWVPDEQFAETARELYVRYPQGDPQVRLASKPGSSGIVWQRLSASWMTAAVLLLTLLVAAVTLLGDNLGSLHWLSFQDFRIQSDYLLFTPLSDSLAAGQWWRLVTPMLVHFGVLHLAMNAMWYWELGRRIEQQQGPWCLLLLTLLYGLVSNLAQYWFGGPSLFGGLSGVLYGLLGYCWIYQRLAPTSAYRLPPGVLVMMLVWLLLCLSGLITALGFGSIANAAHVGGLLVGCLTGLFGGALARLRR